MADLSELLTQADEKHPPADIDVRFELLHASFERERLLVWLAQNALGRLDAALGLVNAWRVDLLQAQRAAQARSFAEGLEAMRPALERVVDPSSGFSYAVQDRTECVRDLLDEHVVRVLTDKAQFNKEIDAYLLNLNGRHRELMEEAISATIDGIGESPASRVTHFRRAQKALEQRAVGREEEPDPVVSLYTGWLRWRLEEEPQAVIDALFSAALHSRASRGSVFVLSSRLIARIQYLTGNLDGALNWLQQALEVRQDPDALLDATVVGGFADRQEEVGRLFEYFGRTDPLALVDLLSEWSYDRRGEYDA